MEAANSGRLPLYYVATSVILSLKDITNIVAPRFAARRIRPVCGPVAGQPKHCFFTPRKRLTEGWLQQRKKRHV